MTIRDATLVDWPARCAEFEARQGALDADELDEWGQALWFLGREEESERAWERAHVSFLEGGDLERAARCAFWLGFTLSEHGHALKAGAWMGRVVELCEAPGATARMTATRSLCLAGGAYASRDTGASVALFRTAMQEADAVTDGDLTVLATMGLGRSLVEMGEYVEGFAFLDRVMLLIGAGQASDRAAGPAYCAVIASLLARWDIERARVWTRELGDWCDAQRGLEPFRGECTLHRATVLQIGGEWESAVDAARHVCETDRRGDTLGNAWYRVAELHRVTGRRGEAEAAYREAANLGREVQPGLALLHRDAGELAVARAGLTRALAAAGQPAQRADMLAAAVRVAIDGDRIPEAEAAATELEAIATAFDTAYLRALSGRARGEVAVAQGRTETAVRALRRAWTDWQQVGAPYEAALTRITMGCAYRAASDEEGALLEFDAARRTLEGLGAMPDLARLERTAAPAAPGRIAGLSPRESEVIALVARGWSNRRIAEHLFLSERTVARHVSNILAKVGTANRAGATAFALAHGLAAAS